MPYKPVEIANEFLRLPGAIGYITQMQLQKLTYIAHGWNLAINGEPLTDVEPKAWTYGPVYPSLYEHTKYYGREPIKREITSGDRTVYRFFGTGNPENEPAYRANLSRREREVIENVWRRYGHVSGTKLSELTHQPDSPWFKAYQREQGSALSSKEIRDHYLQLAEIAARTAAPI
jgi:uncharacterized phage-associated protein